MATVEDLKSFILQAHTDNLKTSNYSKTYSDLKMKVSFGMGTPARVPWISYTAPGMSTSKGFYPVILYYKDVGKLVLAYGISETNQTEESWDSSISQQFPQIGQVIVGAPRYGDSYVHKVYEVETPDMEVFLSNSGVPVSLEDVRVELAQIILIYKRALDQEIKEEGSLLNSGLFYMETQLEDFIIENWESLDLSKSLELIYELGELKSQQFQTDIGRIDILAKDRHNGSYVVIELKRNQTSDDTIGQVMRYMGWVRRTFKDESVRGIIVAGKFDEKLSYAQEMAQNIDVFLYEVQFALREHRK